MKWGWVLLFLFLLLAQSTDAYQRPEHMYFGPDFRIGDTFEYQYETTLETSPGVLETYNRYVSSHGSNYDYHRTVYEIVKDFAGAGYWDILYNSTPYFALKTFYEHGPKIRFTNATIYRTSIIEPSKYTEEGDTALKNIFQFEVDEYGEYQELEHSGFYSGAEEIPTERLMTISREIDSGLFTRTIIDSRTYGRDDHVRYIQSESITKLSIENGVLFERIRTERYSVDGTVYLIRSQYVTHLTRGPFWLNNEVRFENFRALINSRVGDFDIGFVLVSVILIGIVRKPKTK